MAADPLELVDEWPCRTVAVVARTAAGEFRRGPVGSQFPLASVTKLLTATAVLVAAEEEVVHLDERVTEQGATLADVLAHAAGLAPDDAGWTVARPRTRRVYGNAGYELAADLVATASGIDFPTYCREAVFEPLGMTTARIDGSPAAGGVASAADLARFAAALADGTVPLAPATLERMVRPHLAGLPGVLPGYGQQEDNQWGLGPEIRGGKDPHWTGAGNSPATFGHFGRSGTFLWVDPVHGALLVCLTDRDFDDWARTRWPALSDAVLASAPET